MAEFDKWDHRFIQMVNLVAQWSSCFQENRKIGAVIVKNKRVLTTGYNGAPANTLSCVETVSYTHLDVYKRQGKQFGADVDGKFLHFHAHRAADQHMPQLVNDNQHTQYQNGNDIRQKYNPLFYMVSTNRRTCLSISKISSKDGSLPPENFPMVFSMISAIS